MEPCRSDRLINLANVVVLLFTCLTLTNAITFPSSKQNPTIIEAFHETSYNHYHVEGETVEFGQEIASKNTVNDVAHNYQLPKTLVPVRYQLQLQPYLDEDDAKEKINTFDGTVSITFRAKIPTKQIVLHSKTLNINNKSIKVLDADNQPLKVTGTHYIVEEDKYVIDLDTQIQPLDDNTKVYTVSMDFAGSLLQEDLKGFYKSSYKLDDKTINLATTQFESFGARRAFPCFDQPEYKAIFALTIQARDKYTAVVSNTPQTSSTKKDGITTTVFKDTPVMSSYLVAFVVSDFVPTTISKKDLTMTVYSSSKYKDFADQSLKFGKVALDALSAILDDYYKNMEKLDMIGIPDFAAGAMENWGLVTFREPQLFFDKDTSTSVNKNNIYETITHEFAHQWFGDLVTPLHWKFIWLNEGFATYWQYAVLDEIVQNLPDPYKEKSWRSMERLATDARQRAFKFDGLANKTRPMTSEAATLNEVDALFDTIVYQKAGAVLFMLENILTTDVWKAGLKTYLANRDHNSAVPQDLWDALQNAYDTAYTTDSSKVPDLYDLSVADIGISWTYQAGYPVVNVTKLDNSTVRFEQKQFYYDEKTTHQSRFLIPINMAFQSTLKTDLDKTQPTDWLTTGEKTVAIPETADFILINNQQTGYYRVNYDDDNWQKIIDYLALNTTDLNSIKQVTLAQLIDDALNLARAGHLSYKKAFDLAQILNKITDYIPWTAAVSNFQLLDSQIIGTDSEKSYKLFQQNIIKEVYDTVAFNKSMADDDHITGLQRFNIMKRACSVELEDCLTQSYTKLDSVLNDTKSTVEPDIQEALYCSGARSAEEADYDRLMERYVNHTGISATEKKNIIRGVGCFMDDKILKKLLDEAIKENGSLIHDNALDAFYGMMDAGSLGVQTVLDYLGDNYDKVNTTFGETKAETLVSKLANHLATEDYFKKAKSLRDKYDQKSSPVFEMILSQIQSNIDWNTQHMGEISDWLDANYPSSSIVLQVNILLMGFTLLITYLFRN